MSKIMNKTSYLLFFAVIVLSDLFFYFNFKNTVNPIMIIILIIPLTYFALWIVYYFSMYLLKLIKRETVNKKTELVNLILIITLIEFVIMFSELYVNWNYRLLTVISDLITALGYFFFATNVEETTPKKATIYALSVTVLQTLFMII